MNFSKIEDLINDAKKGKMFILVDDENRENEGDLIIPASKVTAKSSMDGLIGNEIIIHSNKEISCK